MTEPTGDTLQAMMLAMLKAANNSEGYAAVQQYGIGPGGDAEMRAVFRVVQDALAAQGADTRPCTCHPDDNPPRPCPRKFALGECRAASEAAQGAEPAAWQHKPDRAGAIWVLSHMSPDEATAWNDIAESRPLYYHPPPAAQPAPATEPLGLTGGGHSVAGAPGWIACAERMPPLGEEVLVCLSEPEFKDGFRLVIDCWDEQYEAPLPFSSATLPVGPGWDSGAYFEQISHWMPLPPLPTAKDE